VYRIAAENWHRGRRGHSVDRVKTCSECGEAASRLRRERCDACYMRLYRAGEVPVGGSCGGCDERRRELLCLEPVGGADAVVCGNCALLLRRTRPRIANLDELRRRRTRERRAQVRRPTAAPFDVSCD
jgi:predicted metal-binding protein